MDEIYFKHARHLLEAQIGHDLSLNLSGTVSLYAAINAIAAALRSRPEVSEVTRQLIERDQKGREKYGTTLDRRDLAPAQWAQHMAEELMDAAGYALALKRELECAPAAAGFHGMSRNNAADELLDVLYAAISDSGAAVHRRLAGCPIATDEITYEIWQDDMMVASSTDPKDASHYAAVYSQDGPVKVYTVLRSEWERLNGGIVRGAGQMPAGGAQPVAWVAADTLNSPHPTCISSLAYMSQLDRERGREYVPLYTAPVAAQAPAADGDALREAVKIAYGYLWHVSNVLGTPNQYAPERAAYKARIVLREQLTKDERGEGINVVRAAMQRTSGGEE